MPFVDEYLARLATERPAAADIQALRILHATHLQRVPFENLGIALGEPISLEVDELAAKILGRGRGGFCYELNGLFAELVNCLGFGVTRLAASVWMGDSYGPPLDHLALLVRCDDGSEWLADVGFGKHSQLPLRWALGVDQDDPNGSFRLDHGDNGDVVVAMDGTPQYRLESRPRQLGEFAAMCWYQQHSPDSHFTQDVVCSRSTERGRVSLSVDRLIVTEDGARTETELPDDGAILAAYREHFGIDLDRVPRLGRR